MFENLPTHSCFSCPTNQATKLVETRFNVEGVEVPPPEKDISALLPCMPCQIQLSIIILKLGGILSHRNGLFLPFTPSIDTIVPEISVVIHAGIDLWILLTETR